MGLVTARTYSKCYDLIGYYTFSSIKIKRININLVDMIYTALEASHHEEFVLCCPLHKEIDVKFLPTENPLSYQIIDIFTYHYLVILFWEKYEI